jgi:hypothetical protein
MSNNIELKSIKALLGMNFYIPDYQRGYRWTSQTVTDLLDDIQEFIQKGKNGIYCIQPLVVKRRETNILDSIKNDAKTIEDVERILKGHWEVIDGQQRLTTIYILLTYLGVDNKYLIDYATREGSRGFLQSIDDSKAEDNIDYCYMIQTKNTIKGWFEEKGVMKSEFGQVLLEKVKFIWYETDEKKPTDVFTRLNIGKISLTNSELIKALFLNCTNFETKDAAKIRLRQVEIASEWDRIEYTLQKEAYWFFIHNQEYVNPTRIDFLFEILKEQNKLGLTEQELIVSGTDKYSTFRYFYEYFKKNTKTPEECINLVWKYVIELFDTFTEWYDSVNLYHYIGYLVSLEKRKEVDLIKELLVKWDDKNTNKSEFAEYLITRIKGKISQCRDLSTQYVGGSKVKCRPLLLLYNIQTIINQNSDLENTQKYKMGIFYKFPFHLYKKEGWDIEHIDSHKENGLKNDKDRNEYLKASILGLSDSEDDIKIKGDVKAFLDKTNGRDDKEFNRLRDELNHENGGNKLVGEEKDKIWNFALLDSGTNRGYKNAPFPAKRRIIIGKDQGIQYVVDDSLEVKPQKGASAFIPPCTRNAFMKYYSVGANIIREWNKDDARDYKKNIELVLNKFDILDSEPNV